MSFDVEEDWEQIGELFERECPNPEIGEDRMKCGKLEISKPDRMVEFNTESTSASMRVEKVRDRKGELHIETKYSGEVTYRP